MKPEGKIKHGYYNPVWERLFGSSEYLTPSGKPVTTTIVREDRYPDDGTTFLHKDTVYVGEVTKWVRQVRKEPVIMDCDDIDDARYKQEEGCACHNVHLACPLCATVYLAWTSRGCQLHRGLATKYHPAKHCNACKEKLEKNAVSKGGDARDRPS